MNDRQLRNFWDENKHFYEQKEIGSGVEDFVIKVFESEIFKFKNGSPTKEDESRSWEYTKQTSRNGRRTDLLIYIDKNIKIPVEVEKYNNIKEGEIQIETYKKDWNTNYGILTDGYKWRFFNNEDFVEINLDYILDNVENFKIFFSNYIKKESYYLKLFNKEYNLFGIEEKKVKDCEDEFYDDTTDLIKKFSVDLTFYTDIRDERQKAEIAYSYLIQFILIKTLVDYGYNPYKEKFDDLIKYIQDSLSNYSIQYSKILAKIVELSELIQTNIYKPFSKDQELINRELKQLSIKNEEDIKDITKWLDIIVYIYKYNFRGIENDIFGSIYENYLKNERGNQLGQFFTDKQIVNFMLSEIGWNRQYIQEKIKNNELDKLSIIDPSCGSGTFLYTATHILISAIDWDTIKDTDLVKQLIEENNTQDKTIITNKFIEKLVNDNIFGLDVEEFSLFLAEMSIIMRLLPCIINEKYNLPLEKKLKILKTKDSISEFDSVEKFRKNNDPVELKFSFFKEEELKQTFMRDEKDVKELKESLIPTQKRFDFVIGNPPYIGYNECCKMKMLFTQEMKMNNIYGVNLNSIPNKPKKYSPKPNLYAFFIALANGLLKNNSTFCYIIPQTLLTANDLDVIRYYLSSKMTVLTIITFANNCFIGRGRDKTNKIATSSMILIVQKTELSSEERKKHKVKIINYLEYDSKVEDAVNDINENRNIDIKEISQQELLKNVSNWNYIKYNKVVLDLIKLYNSNYSINNYRKFVLNNYDDISLDGGVNLDNNLIEENFINNSYYIFNNKKNNYLTYNINNKFLFYKKDSKIDFIAGSQGLKAFKNKYKIIWKTNFNNIFQYSDQEDLLLNGNQSLLISSNNKKEILWLLSLLNNKISLFILNKQCRLPNEVNFLVALKSIKQYIKIPTITENNKHIKDKIVETTENMLDLETKTLSDYVDFSCNELLPVNFKSVNVKDNFLICDEFKFKIKDNEFFVEKCIDSIKNEFQENIALKTLKEYEAVDFELRDKLKEYIDLLVYSLYFDIKLKKYEFKDIEYIRSECAKNKFYNLIYDRQK